jgi:hypothetical protein
VPNARPPLWLGLVAAVGSIALTTLIVYPPEVDVRLVAQRSASG